MFHWYFILRETFLFLAVWISSPFPIFEQTHFFIYFLPLLVPHLLTATEPCLLLSFIGHELLDYTLFLSHSFLHLLKFSSANNDLIGGCKWCKKVFIFIGLRCIILINFVRIKISGMHHLEEVASILFRIQRKVWDAWKFSAPTASKSFYVPNTAALSIFLSFSL